MKTTNLRSLEKMDSRFNDWKCNNIKTWKITRDKKNYHMHIVGWKTSDYVVFEHTSSVAKKNNISQVSCSKLTRHKLGRKLQKKNCKQICLLVRYSCMMKLKSLIILISQHVVIFAAQSSSEFRTVSLFLICHQWYARKRKIERQINDSQLHDIPPIIRPPL